MIKGKWCLLWCCLYLLAGGPLFGDLKPIDKEFNEQSLQRQINQTIIRQLKKNRGDLKEEHIGVTYHNLNKVIENIPKKAIYYDVHLEDNAKIVGRTIIRLRLFNKKKFYISRLSMLTTVDAKKEYYLSQKRMVKGYIIKEEDIKTEFLSIRNKPRNACEILENLIGKQVQYTIQKDALLLDWMIKVKPVIQKGDPVMAIIKNKGINLEMKAMAIESSGINNTVSIRIEKTKKILYGKVVGKNRVEVLLSN